MKHIRFMLALVLLFVVLVGVVQSGETAVFTPTSHSKQITHDNQAITAIPGTWHRTAPRGGSAEALALSPDFANDGIVFTGEWHSNYQGSETGSRVIKSADFGQNWAVSAVGMMEMGNETAVHDYAFSNNFASDHTLFAATGGGLFQSVDSGANWVRNDALYQGPPGIINHIAVSPAFATDGHMMAVGGYGGLFLSQDSGTNWDMITPNLISAIAYSPAFASDETAFMAESYADSGNYLQRVAKTEDRGVTWTGIYSASVQTIVPSPHYALDQTLFAGGTAFSLSTDGGTTWLMRTIAADTGWINALAVSPQFATDQTLFAGTNNGLYHSSDGGQSWQAVAGYENMPILRLSISPAWPTQEILLVGTWQGVFRLLTDDPAVGETKEATQGLMELTVSVMAMPSDESLLLTGTSNHGLYATGDKGQTWQPVGFNGGAFYSGASALAFSPNYTTDETIFAAYGGKYTNYYRSTDAGATWDRLYSIYNYANIAVSPNFAVDQTVFATGEDVGKLKKSTDGGDSWQTLDSWDRTRGGHLLALPPNYGENGRLFIGTMQGFWYSPDAGLNWQQSATGLVSDRSLKALKVSPNYANDQTLLAVAYWTDAAYEPHHGIYKSVDGGVNWRLTQLPGSSSDESINDIAFSPHYAVDQTAYLTTDDELYRSLDGGLSWQVVGSPPGVPILRFVLVDSAGQVIVSSGSGVWWYQTVTQEWLENGSFELDAAWDLPNTPIPAEYSAEIVYNGRRAMQIGLNGEANVYGYSSARQVFTLPDDPLLAELSFYLYQMSGEETAVLPEPTNHQTVTTGDVQYICLLDATGTTHLETLFWDLSNTQTWHKQTVTLSHYAGQEIMLHFGVINDGQNGTTGMFVDDVSLLVIDGAPYPNKTYLPVVFR